VGIIAEPAACIRRVLRLVSKVRAFRGSPMCGLEEGFPAMPWAWPRDVLSSGVAVSLAGATAWYRNAS
ncbi:MAG TPA: hypothetical protein VFO16_14580, partial [Pseudonocardiaceae bacterium]|nr:hypothetical protein [Pseudonocardiaceae bacterium]